MHSVIRAFAGHRHKVKFRLGSRAYMFNPFKLNGMSKSYQLDEPISVLRVVRWLFKL